MSPPAIRIGTRGSALALVQAQLVEAALGRTALRPVELVIVETEGDRRAPDTAWGEGAFVAALERALHEGRVDLAVHSAKDIPTHEDRRLAIGAYLPRADPRDALVLPAGVAGGLATLAAGARVGTDSPRRSGFVRAARSDLRVHSLHGNVDTRLRRLDGGETDALVLAMAGLSRLGRTDRVSEVLDPLVVLPAAGQGAIAVQYRSEDVAMGAMLAEVDDGPTRLTVEAERAFLAASGGGCRAPIGAHARIEGAWLVLVGGHVAPDGSAVAFDEMRGRAGDAAALGVALATRLLPRTPSRAARAATRPRVLITRASGQGDALTTALAREGIDVASVPAIEIESAGHSEALTRVMGHLERLDWVVVTSPNGARAMVAAMQAGMGRWPADPRTRLAAVGDVTARVLEDANLPVAHVPNEASSEALGRDLPLMPGERILLARGDLADDRLPDALRARGAHVEEIVAYSTREAPASSGPLLAEARARRIDGVLFASASAVRGLLALDPPGRALLTQIPAICIGPETAAEARRHGWHVLREASSASSEALARTTAEALGVAAEAS